MRSHLARYLFGSRTGRRVSHKPRKYTETKNHCRELQSKEWRDIMEHRRRQAAVLALGRQREARLSLFSIVDGSIGLMLPPKMPPMNRGASRPSTTTAKPVASHSALFHFISAWARRIRSIESKLIGPRGASRWPQTTCEKTRRSSSVNPGSCALGFSCREQPFG